VHRDIKPGNILLEAPGDRVKLTDFGLVRSTEDTKLTQTGYVTGTPMYMAPEQALGQQADERADLFSLGAVLYEMATGQPPFSAPTILGISKIVPGVARGGCFSD
jgi:serine/threonine protein kinase